MEVEAVKFLAVTLTMVGTVFAAGAGLSKVFTSWLDGIARNPSAATSLSKAGFIAFAGTELVLLMGFVISIMTLNK